MRTINFASKAGPHLASHRMRCEIPSRLLNESGLKSVVTSKGSPTYDVNIFSKHFSAQEMLDEAYYCKDKGSTVVYDICDNHFNRDAAPIYKAMCDIAHKITCNTPRLKEKILQYTGKEAYLVSDPITFPFRIPRVNRDNSPKILFFGHSSNLKPLLEVAEEIPEREIVAVTNADKQRIRNVSILPWSLGLTEDLIQYFDIVLLPQKGQRFWVKDKSPNRAVDALHSGCFVIADTPEIYEELSPYIFLGGIKDGLNYYTENSNKVYSQIREGQKFIQKEFGHEKVLEQWKKVVE